MGIVAFCPNGHRINVKDSFAGRKGRCPTCGAKFRVPLAGSAFGGPGSGTTDAVSALPTARLLDVDPAVIATLPRVIPFDAPLAPAEPAVISPLGSAAFEPAAPPEPALAPEPTFAPPPAPIAAAPSLHPVLAERPDMTWCIAFPGGEPTEPLPAESMQAWLDSGEAEGTQVVWRSDWPEWRPARDVFPDVIG